MLKKLRYRGFNKKTVLDSFAQELVRLQEVFVASDDPKESMRVGTLHAYLREIYDFLRVSESLESTQECPAVAFILEEHIDGIDLVIVREFLSLVKMQSARAE